jgi:hypothetical protein
MSLTTILTAPQAGMSTSKAPVTSHTWWSLLSEQERLQCVDQGESWTIKRRRRWGNKTAWNPAGRLLELWKTELYDTIKTIINDPGNYNKIYGDGSHHPGLGRHLWMVADKCVYQEAHPTIVIACKEKRFAKNTIQLLEEMESSRCLNLGFGFLAHNSKIQHKAASGGLYPQSEFLESLCGTEVLLPSVQTSVDAPSSLWPRATIGGVLKLGQPFYALTVAHVLHPCNPESDDETASWSGSESDCDTEEFDLSHETHKSSGSGDAAITLAIKEPSKARGGTLDEKFDFNAGELSNQFEQHFRTRRLNELEERATTTRPSSPASFQRRVSGHSPSPYPRNPATPKSASQVSPRPTASDQPRERHILATISATHQPPRSSMYPAFVDIRPREATPTKRVESSELKKEWSNGSLGCIGNLYSTIQPESVSDVNSSHDSSVWVCHELDWALIKISDPRFCRPNQIPHPAGHTLKPKSISPKSSPPRGSVLTAAGVSGIYESNCSGILCGLTLPGTTLMVDAWVVNSGSRMHPA